MSLRKRRERFIREFMERDGATITQARKAWKAFRQEQRRRRRTLTDQVNALCQRRGHKSRSPHRRPKEKHT